MKYITILYYIMDSLLCDLLDKHMKLFNERESDIYIRGSDCEVYNIDGSISYLRNTLIWTDKNGNYVKPKEVNSKKCRWCCWK